MPKYLIRDHDGKFGPSFARVADTSGIKVLKTPYHAPRANAICERFLRSVRQACLDHLLILQEKQHEPRAQCLCDLLQPSTTAGSASSSRFPPPVDHLVLLRTKQQRWLLFRSWLGCTMTTERRRNEETSEPTIHERAQRCQDGIVDGHHTFERRPLALHPFRSLERMLQAPGCLA
jgi:hypothetical protein